MLNTQTRRIAMTLAALTALFVQQHAAAQCGTWLPLGDGLSSSDYNAQVYAYAKLNGELLAGGEGLVIPGVPGTSTLARWNGTEWRPFNTGNPSGPVWAFTFFHGDLIVGGWFATAGGQVVNNIARWDGSCWQPLGSGTNSAVHSLCVYHGELIAGGWFTTADDQPATFIARWNGATWQSMGEGISGPNSSVESLVIFNDELVVFGYFQGAGEQPISDIARWNGSLWQGLAGGVHSVIQRCVTVYNGELVAGGRLRRTGGHSSFLPARWDGNSWATIGTGVSSGCGHGQGPDIWAMPIYNGNLIAVGQFCKAGGQTASHVARWDGSGWRPVGANIFPLTTSTYSATTYRGELIVGGQITLNGSASPSYHVVHWRDCVQCPNDITHNGQVDVDDLLLVIANWGALGESPGDATDDGIVNVDDLLSVLIAWGPCS